MATKIWLHTGSGGEEEGEGGPKPAWCTCIHVCTNVLIYITVEISKCDETLRAAIDKQHSYNTRQYTF